MPDLVPETAPHPAAARASGGEPANGLEPRLGVVRNVADEIRWTFTKRWGWIGQILLNLAIGLPVVIAMAWNPTHDDVRVSGFATSIAGWVLASALNTNQLGFDADRAAAAVDAVAPRRTFVLLLGGASSPDRAAATYPAIAYALVARGLAVRLPSVYAVGVDASRTARGPEPTVTVDISTLHPTARVGPPGSGR